MSEYSGYREDKYFENLLLNELDYNNNIDKKVNIEIELNENEYSYYLAELQVTIFNGCIEHIEVESFFKIEYCNSIKDDIETVVCDDILIDKIIDKNIDKIFNAAIEY